MKQTISFVGTVSASSVLTLASKKIGRPYRFDSINIYFPRGSNLLTQYKVFFSYDDYCPASGEPSGTNVFETYGQSPYVIGEEVLLPIHNTVEVREIDTYIKVYVKNNDTFDHTVVCYIDIELDFEKEIAAVEKT